VIEATLPISTVTLEVFVFRQQVFGWRMAAAVALGFCGVVVLLISGHEQAFPVLPCLVILAAGVAWSLGAVLTRSMPRPQSSSLAAGAQMLLGGAVLLGLSLATGELHSLPHISLRAGLALSYLIVGGSLVGFTAYVWLLTRMPATRVASHAYVNPLVAVALGYFVAGEVLTPRTLLAAVLVVAAVFLVLTTPSARRQRPLLQSPPGSDISRAPHRLHDRHFLLTPPGRARQLARHRPSPLSSHLRRRI
jgi:drug/metabolite transporter (DMT)-like permease